MDDTQLWLAARRDHDGNYDLLKMPDGTSFAWDLSEEQADRVIEHVQRLHLKPHGQSYWKMPYPKHAKIEFLRTRSIRV